MKRKHRQADVSQLIEQLAVKGKTGPEIFAHLRAQGISERGLKEAFSSLDYQLSPQLYNWPISLLGTILRQVKVMCQTNTGPKVVGEAAKQGWPLGQVAEALLQLGYVIAFDRVGGSTYVYVTNTPVEAGLPTLRASAGAYSLPPVEWKGVND